MSTITTTTTQVVVTPTSTSTITILGIGQSALTFPSIGIHSTVHSTGIAGAAAHTGTAHTIAGDGTITAGAVLTTTATTIHIMAEAAWAATWQASDTITATLLDRWAIALSNSPMAEIRLAFRADHQLEVLRLDLRLVEHRHDQRQAFPVELARLPVHRQVHQVHVQA